MLNTFSMIWGTLCYNERWQLAILVMRASAQVQLCGKSVHFGEWGLYCLAPPETHFIHVHCVVLHTADPHSLQQAASKGRAGQRFLRQYKLRSPHRATIWAVAAADQSCSVLAQEKKMEQ